MNQHNVKYLLTSSNAWIYVDFSWNQNLQLSSIILFLNLKILHILQFSMQVGLKNYSHVSLVEVPVHAVHETCTRAWSRTGRRTGGGSRSSEQGSMGGRMFCR
jgi:hypothetical protein